MSKAHAAVSSTATQQKVRWLLWLLLLLPPLSLFLLLGRVMTGLPFYDDYNAALTFALEFKHAGGALQKLSVIFLHAFNEYHLILQNLIYALQYTLLGRLELKSLSAIGNLFIIPIAVFLCLFLRQFPQPPRGNQFLLSCVPISWMVFELQDASNFNAPVAPWQNLAALSFFLGALYFANRRALPSTVLAVVFSILAIGASGNGVLAVPFTALVFLLRQQYRRALLYLCPMAAVVLLYERVAVHTHLGRPSLLWAAAFNGSIVTKTNPLPAVAFSVLLLAVFLYAVHAKLYRTQPAIFAGALFFFCQSLVVSMIRAPLGLVTALGSRYRINSLVLFLLLYLFAVDQCRALRLPRFAKIAGLTAAALVLGLFTVVSDLAGYRLLKQRRTLVQQGIGYWERHETRPAIQLDSAQGFMARNANSGLYDPLDPPLTQAIQEGVYRLPPPGPNR